MIRFIQKLIFLWDKKKHLTGVELEIAYVSEKYAHELGKDVSILRNSMREIKEKTDLTSNDKKRILELEKEINEIESYRGMINQGETRRRELEDFIVNIKKNLWK